MSIKNSAFRSGFAVSVLLLSAFLSGPLWAQEPQQQSSGERPSGQLQKAMDLLIDTEETLLKQKELIESLQQEMSGSKTDLLALEALRTEASAMFDRQSALLLESNLSLRRWRMAAICGIPAALLAGLLTGLLAR